MTTKKREPIGSSVQDWFDEEEARSPGFIAELDEANLRGSVATQLKALRTGCGRTQAALAALLGVKQPVIARIESGKVMPDLRTVHRYAHALGYLVDPPSFRPMPASKAAAKQERNKVVAEMWDSIERSKASREAKRWAAVRNEPKKASAVVVRRWALLKRPARKPDSAKPEHRRTR